MGVSLKLKECHCVECQTSFWKPLTSTKLTCSDPCRLQRLGKQLQELSASRKKPRAQKKCEVCGKKFKPKFPRHKYCDNPLCKQKGLEQAVERQRLRRELQKKEKVNANC
jgi:hypothetical protein